MAETKGKLPIAFRMLSNKKLPIKTNNFLSKRNSADNSWIRNILQIQVYMRT